MELPRGERLISLYQYLTRGKCNAKSLTELIAVFNPTREKPKSRAKLLENDLLALFSLLGEEAHCMPSKLGRRHNFRQNSKILY